MVDINELIDIRDIVINTELPKDERMADFLAQIKNPYLCRYGDFIIESVFSDEEITLTDRLKQHCKMS
ncbi:MAG: hypothetical protein BEN19_00680 [Epulopiscium sp. Nuni2H_MBin003]|nr:MAG: hypothetical protein BEN19_00680 [Epulopiscium sp. Nuni2H_MBin003]